MTEEKILDRVAKLLAIAEHPNTGEHEAEIALSQANRLIAKHAIEEAVLRQAQTIGQRRALARKVIKVNAGEFSSYLTTILVNAAEANRLSAARTYGSVEVFGADEDISWVETLFSMIQLQFLLKINPKWDDAKPVDENIYNFKVAGNKWAEINAVLVAHGGESMENTKTFDRYNWRTGLMESVTEGTGYYHKMFGAYKRYAKKIGDTTPVATQNKEAFRLSYADAFRSTMVERFERMADEAQEEMDTIPGAAMVMVSQKAESDRMMWDAFPFMDPEEIAKRNAAYQEHARKEAEARQAMLDAMTPAQRRKFLDDEERKAARLSREARRGIKYYSFDESARRKGASAAKSMDISRKSGSAGQSGARAELG